MGGQGRGWDDGELGDGGGRMGVGGQGVGAGGVGGGGWEGESLVRYLPNLASYQDHLGSSLKH